MFKNQQQLFRIEEQMGDFPDKNDTKVTGNKRKDKLNFMKIKCLLYVKRHYQQSKLAIHGMGENEDTNRESQAHAQGRLSLAPFFLLALWILLLTGCDSQRIPNASNLPAAFDYKVTLLPPWQPSGQINKHHQLLSISLRMHAVDPFYTIYPSIPYRCTNMSRVRSVSSALTLPYICHIALSLCSSHLMLL